MKIDLFSTTIFEHLIDDFGIYDDAKLPTKPDFYLILNNKTTSVAGE